MPLLPLIMTKLAIAALLGIAANLAPTPPTEQPELAPAQIDTVHLVAWRTTIERNSRDRIYHRIYGYVLSEGNDLGFDLVRRDGSERPAYQWLRSWTRHR